MSASSSSSTPPPTDIVFPLKTLPNGKPNPTYVDVLTVHQVPKTQKYGLFSFISPEKVIGKFETFCQERFFESRIKESAFKMESMFTAWLIERFNLDPDEITTAFNKYQEMTTEQYSCSYREAYRLFLENEHANLQKEFNQANDVTCSVRSFKFYGAFSTEEGARKYSKTIKEKDVAIIPGKSGTWLHWDPTGLQHEYADERVNNLLTKQKENHINATKEFDARITAAKNHNKAVLTKDVDEDEDVEDVAPEPSFK